VLLAENTTFSESYVTGWIKKKEMVQESGGSSVAGRFNTMKLELNSVNMLSDVSVSVNITNEREPVKMWQNMKFKFLR
jgi:hypothetical protein